MNANHPPQLRYCDNAEADDHHAAAVEDVKQQALQPFICSCAPLEYNFILNLDSNCETNDIKCQPGIGQTSCFLGNIATPPISDARTGKSSKSTGETSAKSTKYGTASPTSDTLMTSAKD